MGGLFSEAPPASSRKPEAAAAAYFTPSPAALVFSARFFSTILDRTMDRAVPMGVKTTVQQASGPLY